MSKRNIPWYKNPKNKLMNAYELYFGLKFRFSAKIKKEVMTFWAECTTRFIYESNILEKEGADWHETRKLLIKPAEKKAKSIRFLKSFGLQPRLWVPLKEQGMVKKPPRFVMARGRLKKELRMVRQHFDALLQTIEWVGEYYHAISLRYHWDHLRNPKTRKKLGKKKSKKIIQKVFNGRLPNKRPQSISFLTEHKICRLHKILSSSFIKSKDGEPGTYRKIPVMTGPSSHYPTPELLPACMKKFIKSSNHLLKGNADPIRIAAKISGEFILIHPFLDFNGRVSRLIMNAILFSYGFVFPVSIRANKKSKHRYFYSLKLGKSGKWDHLTSLMAIEIVNMLGDFNRILGKAGIKEISQKPIPTKLLPTLDEPLDY